MNAVGESTRNALLLLLSVAAGCVDAIAFLNAGIFPANMTGNSVILASTLLHPSANTAAHSALALLGFCIGAGAGAWAVHARDHAWSRRTSAVLFVAGLLVLGSAIAMAFAHGRYLPYSIVAASIAMGLQSAAVQQLGVAGVATVFVTGTLTTTIGRIVARLRHTSASDGTAPPADPLLPGLSWLSYFVGAFLGGLQLAWPTNLPIALPGAILLAVAIVSARCLRRP